MSETQKNQDPDNKPLKDLKTKPTNLRVEQATLHSAIIICGQTEATISKTKLRSLETIEWTPNGFLLIRAKNAKGETKTHLLPGAAVKDSILAE